MVLVVRILPNPEAIEPEERAPTVVSEEPVTVVPRAVDESTLVPPILYAPPIILRLPDVSRVRRVVPEDEAVRMSVPAPFD